MSARPGRITHLIDVDLERPRGVATRESPRYFELVTEVREALRPARAERRRDRSRLAGAQRRRRRHRMTRAAGAVRRYAPAIIVARRPARGVGGRRRGCWASRASSFPRRRPSGRRCSDNWSDELPDLPGRAGDAVRGARRTGARARPSAWRSRSSCRAFPISRDAILPVAVAVNAIPIIAFAPLANNWFGIQSPMSKMAVAASLVFFPIMINTLRGPDPGRAIGDRADALVRRRRWVGHPSPPDPERAPLLPDRSQDRDDPARSSAPWSASTSAG